VSVRGSRFKGLDWMTVWLYLLMVSVGVAMIYAVDNGAEQVSSVGDFFGTAAGKQLIWVGISAIVMLVIFFIDWRFWRAFAYPIYVFSLLLLIGVLFFGTTVKGATSWFYIGGFSFQPSEFAKFATCLALANYLSGYNADVRQLRSLFISVGLFLAPMLFILAQPDAGSALVFLSFLVVLYRQGLSPTIFIVGGLLIALEMAALYFDSIDAIFAILLAFGSLVLFDRFREQYWLLAGLIVTAVTLFVVFSYNYVESSEATLLLFINAGIAGVLGLIYLLRGKQRLVLSTLLAIVVAGGLAYSTNYVFYQVLKPHQQDRINVWLRPDKSDPRGSLYNVNQSKMAIGSGGITGKGYLQGNMTRLNYVPEQSTDFIFCTIGEEQGFVGSFGVIIFFLLLLVRLVSIAERQRGSFSRYYAYGVAGIIFMHFFINIGMTMGLTPIIGIPLPFISKGGSSLLGFSLMLAVLLKLDSHRYSI